MTLVCHRRAGKTVASVQKLIYEALTYKRGSMKTAPLRYGYIAPTLTQAKLIAWVYAKSFTAEIPGIVVNESELKITFPNRAEIRLYGMEQADRLRGIYLDGCIVDEADDVPDSAITYILTPCLLDYQGFLIFTGTPKGRGKLYRSIQRAKEDDTRYSLVLKASKSGLIPQADLDEMRAEIGEEAYLQEMECDFTVAREGAIYATQLQTAIDDGRVVDFKHSDANLVFTSWDLGSPKNTVCLYWIRDTMNLTYQLIDCDSNLEMSTAERVAHMLAKGYNFGQHFLPHDGRTKGADNMSFAAKLRDAGLSNVEVLDNAGKGAEAKRIRAMHDIFPQIWFNKSKLEGDGGMLDALMDYHYKEQKKDGRITSVIDHGFASHYCDAFGYFAEAMLSGRMVDSLTKRGIGRAKTSLGSSMRR
jgi:phage terminase large subunit